MKTSLTDEMISVTIMILLIKSSMGLETCLSHKADENSGDVLSASKSVI